MQTALSLQNISFSYDKSCNSVINDFSLDVEKGSFTTLLGASGSGKTTLLRLIAGFLNPASGTILINGKSVNSLAPEKRKIAIVFQDYALFPHMTVKENLLYGLKLKKDISKEKSEKLIVETSKILDLSLLLDRYPSELSGGQQQRVALGRALVLEPDILLMDEPLSSLDTRLRQAVRTQLKQIQKRLNITTIYVTHDQEEALSLSDKIAVLHDGKLLQYGTPRQVYYSPVDKYTADFIGTANYIDINTESGIKNCMVRPEWLSIVDQKSKEDDVLDGTVSGIEFLGSKVRYSIRTDAGIILVDDSSAGLDNIKENERVMVKVIYKKIM